MDFSGEKNGPIIRSFLDTDFYKLTMGQFIYRFWDVEVTFSLINRSNIPLGVFISEEDLREELDHARELYLKESELEYLRSLKQGSDHIFSGGYLQFLREIDLPPYHLEMKDCDFSLEFSGPWETVTYWEIIALSILSELYRRGQLRMVRAEDRQTIHNQGVVRLTEKLKTFHRHRGITISDFGTRRRFSYDWQDYVVRTLAKELPGQFLGTSNPFLAMKYNLKPIGTFAHELPMVLSALFVENKTSGPYLEALLHAQRMVLSNWFSMYGSDYSITPTDTFGSDFFFRTASFSIARSWKGTRQDSGDPIAYGKKTIRWYERYGINPQEKVIVFSDDLNPEKVVKIHDRFGDQIQCTFGIGKNLTNDFDLIFPSIVVKASKANGRSTVKLSDDPAKAMGDPAEVECYKKAVNYGEPYLG